MNKKKIIIKYILEQISLGRWKPGDKILTKYQLSQYFGVNPNTAQSAVHELIIKGILTSKNGAGVYVTEKPKYIIITTNENFFVRQIANFNQRIISYLKTEIKNMGYEPYINLEKSDKDFSYWYTYPIVSLSSDFKMSDIAGVFSLFGNSKTCEYFTNNDIPVVTLHRSQFPSVTLDWAYFFSKTCGLLKYMGDNIVFFEYTSYDAVKDSRTVEYEYFEKYLYGRYVFNHIDISDTNREVTKNIEKYLKDMKTVPDGIVFADNTLYQNALPLFDKYEHIFGRTKIITHSNSEETYPEGYKICRLAFKLEDFGRPAIEMMKKLTDKQRLLKTVHLVSCEIVNEKIIK